MRRQNRTEERSPYFVGLIVILLYAVIMAVALIAAVTMPDRAHAAPVNATVRATKPFDGWEEHWYGGITMDRHGVVVEYSLKDCAVEDASYGPLPCTWNFDPVGDPQGNGEGLAYWVGPRGGTHYVWPTDPTLGTRWRWVSRPMADALAEGGAPHADKRAWRRCITRYDKRDDATIIRCPDGYREVD